MYNIYYEVPPTFDDGDQIKVKKNVLECALKEIMEAISRRYIVRYCLRID